MAAPAKPWESTPPCCRTPNVNNRMVLPEQIRATSAPVPQFQSTLNGGAVDPTGVGSAPPIPPRPVTGYNSYSSPYGGMSPYSGYGGFGTGYSTGYGVGYSTGYGGAFSGYGGYGAAGGSFLGRPGALGPGPESWFIEAAEESSRSTFESIESFVNVFSSISQMMESTYMLVHSSFRAVVGVAEQMGRMRLHLAELLSAISMARTLRWIVRFLRRWLGYPELDGAWGESSAAVPSSGADGAGQGPPPSRWPVLVYLLTVLGAPYLIYRLLRAGASSQNNENWKSGAGEHFSAVCSYDFTAAGPAELTVRAGQSLRLAPRRLQPRARGWVLASDGTAAGLLPAAYVKIRGLVPAGGAAAVGPGTSDGPAAAAEAAAAGAGTAAVPAAVAASAGAGTAVVPAAEAAAGARAAVVPRSEAVGGSSSSQVSPPPGKAACPAGAAAGDQKVTADGCCSRRPAGGTAGLPSNATVVEVDPTSPAAAFSAGPAVDGSRPAQHQCQ